jgi:hypothetical protein
MSRKVVWYGPDVDKSKAVLWKLRQMCPRQVVSHNGRSWDLVQAIQTAIDDYAELETGNREYFWNRPYRIG